MENDIFDRYAICQETPRQKFVNELSEESAAKSLGKSYELLPLYERDSFERAFIEHYSIANNKNFGCRWRQYKQTMENKVVEPFQLPDIKHLHFYNCAVRYRPSELSNQDHRKKLKPGPGVDYGGQMPIPQEAMMKRGTSKDTGPGKEAGNKKNIKHVPKKGGQKK